MEGPQQAQKARKDVAERRDQRRHSRLGTDEGRESATPKMQTPATAVETRKSASKDERSRKPMTIALGPRMSASRNAFHPHRRQSQVGGVGCQNRTLSPRPALQLRIAIRRKSRKLLIRFQTHENLTCPRSPRRELMSALARP